MHYLKQSTITTIQLGPFLDETDGKTAEEALTLTSTDVWLSKAGAAFANPSDTNAATHDRAGWYRKQLNATDTATVGRLIVSVHESGALPVWREFTVLTSKVYESLVDGTDYLEVDIEAVSGDEAAADNLELDYDGTGYAKANSTMGTVTANTDLVSAAVVADAVWDELVTGHDGAGKAGQQLWTDVDAILADTNELQADDTPAAIAALPTAVENRTEIDSNSTQLAAIVADTSELQVDDVPGLIAALNNVSTAEVNAQVDTALSDIHLDHLLAVDYDPATKPGVVTALLNELVESDVGVSRFTANALEEAPTGGSAPTVGEIADAVWDELVTGHDGAGKAGQQLWTDVDAILADTNELQVDDTPAAIAALPTAVENRTEMDSNSTQLAAIVADTSELQVDDVPGLIGALNDVSTAEVNAQLDTALSDIHLDHLLAVEYDPASQPGVATALLNELIESDVGVSRFTANALEEAPTGGSAPTVGEIADAVWDEASAGHTDAGKAGEQLWTDVDAILADTNELQGDDVPTLIAALPTAVENRTEMDSNSTQLANIVADTNELQVDDVPGLIGALNDISTAEVNAEVDNALADVNLDHLVGSASGIPAVPAGTYIDQMMDDGTATYDRTTDSLQAIRDRGDASWITGGGGGITDILNIQPLIPESVDLANTATWRLGLMLINSLDDLPTTGEITPGTISIDRKAIGGTSWSSVVSDAACSEAAGLVYYDEVFDTGAGYAEGDSLRITFKSQKITVAANDYEITDATGRIFYTEMRQTSGGATAAAVADAVWEEAIADHSGTGGSTAEALAGASAPSAATVADAVWDEAKAGHVGGGSFGEEVQAHALTTEISALNDISTAQVNTEVDTALADYDAPTKAEMDSGFAALNDPTAVAIRTEIDSNSTQLAAIVADTDELQSDDVPGLIAALNDPTADAIADQVWDEAKAGHVGAGSMGEEIQSHALSTEVDAVPTATENRTEMDSNSTKLAAIVADTNELQTDDVPGLIAALNDPAAAAIADQVWEEAIADHSGTAGSTAEALNGATAPSAAAVADQVWEETIADHSGTSGSTAEKLAAAGAAGDPWGTAIPGAYGDGTAGKLLGNLNDPTPAEVWAAATRTLTEQIGNVTIVSAVEGSRITVYEDDTWSFTITDSSLALNAYENLAFVVKNGSGDADTAALLYVRTDTDLVKVNGEDPAASGNGALTNDNTSITVLVAIAETGFGGGGNYTWWLKGYDTTPDPDKGFTLATGTFKINKPGLQAAS